MKQVMTFHYTLTDPSGKVLDSSTGHPPLTFLMGSGQIIPGLETTLQSLKPGDKTRVTVPADQAYGLREERYVMKVPRGQLPEGEIEVGDQFQPGDEENTHPFRVIQVADDSVTLDANHPLAGIDLTFDVEVTEVRQATEEEITHGHIHGPEGHAH